MSGWVNPFADPVFEVGDIVVCRNARSYLFTEGRHYVVEEYTPTDPAPGYTRPAYVAVKDDSGRSVHCHADRFKKA